MKAGSKKDADSTSVPGARRMKTLHAGPDDATPCFHADHICRVRCQVGLRQYNDMR